MKQSNTRPRRKSYRHVEPGEWFGFNRRRQKLACCDCGLVHLFDVRQVGKRLQVRGYRDERATAAVRREKRKSGTHIAS